MTDVRRAEGPIVRAARPSPSRRRVAGERTRPAPTATRTPPATTSRTSDGVSGAPSPSRPRKVASRAGTTAGEAHEAHEARTASGWLLAGLAVVLLLALAAAGAFVVLDRRAQAAEQARGQAVRAASTAATRILSYDYHHLDADFAAGRALTTGAFADQYAKTTGDAVKTLATQTKATVVAQVASAGVQRASADQVVVLMFVNQTTTSNRLERPQVDQNRVEMTMVRRDGRWLVSQVRGL